MKSYCTYGNINTLGGLMDNYYIIARKDQDPESIHISEWPKIIAYSLKTKKFLISEGKGYGCEGSQYLRYGL